MANNPVVNSITFTGSVAGQATLQAQGIAGGLTFLLPNIPPIVGQALSAQAVNGNNIFLNWVSPNANLTVGSFNAGSVQGNGSKVQLTTGSAPPSPVTTALLTAASYTILGASAVTNSDGSSTVINGGNIGSYPTNTITPGTPAWTLDGGTTVVTAVAQNQTDLAAAIAAYQAMGPGTTIPTALDAQVLAPGVYSTLSGTMTISGGTLTLNGAGTYVFLMATTLTLTGASQIALTNGATAANVVFVCGSSMTAAANAGTLFNGNILAHTSITVDGGIYNGRLLANTGAVTISTATVINAPVQQGVIAAGDVVIYDSNGNVVSSGVLLSSLGGAAGVTSFNGRSGAVLPASGDYSVAQVTGAAPLASPALTGTPTAPTAAALDNSTKIATTAYADAAVGVETSRATTAEGLLVPKTTTVNGHALSSNVTVAFADLGGTLAISQINSKQGNGNAVQLTNTGATVTGDVVTYDANSNVVDSGTLLSSLAPKASPTFTGTVTVPTPVNPTDATTKAYVDAADALLAPKASPTFTGTVTLPATVIGNGSALSISESVGGVLISGSNTARGVNVGTALASDGVALQDNAAANALIVGSVEGGILLETSGAGNITASAALVTGTNGNFSLGANIQFTGNTDVRGTITVTNPATTGTFNFSRSFASAPIVVVTPTSDPSVAGIVAYWVTTSVSGITVHVNTTPGTSIVFNYIVIG
jgi:hypothetical protein